MSEPQSSWLTGRHAGVLLHPTSLPGDYGIGSLDENAVGFLEFLAAAGFKAWQICPLGPTGYGDSPYQCFSAFAGNPYLIDVAALIHEGLVTAADAEALQALPKDRVDFGGIYHAKWPVLFGAHAEFVRGGRRILPYGDFEEFRRQQAAWLPDYALFCALKENFKDRPWWEWPAAARNPALARKSALPRELAVRIEAYEFIQYLFLGQWTQLRAKAAALDIAIIGDAPIFAALDSADAWANPQLFQLNPRTARPTAVAGCPPDYFSADGQLWGNPLYNWPVHAADGYAWWIARLRANFALFDVVRIDHFRGFEAYWSIPAGSATARPGHWVLGPGLDFFRAIRAALPGAKLIAEDLGTLTPEVIALREATGLPGMAVLQFAFGGAADNFYLPHHHRANCVVYPGTHDNDTTIGWYAEADEKTRDHVRRYLRVDGQEINWDFLRVAYASVCALTIVPLPDLLGLGSVARFNSPGVAEGNWSWRFRPEQLRSLSDGTVKYLRELAALYDR
ncbi:MAG: 4-alpha-glucanotransferase [Verrucomicrobia bacterium]|nr:4-alpha-glucanotransferase [Verrucomicrobiota bacterium]